MHLSEPASTPDQADLSPLADDAWQNRREKRSDHGAMRTCVVTRAEMPRERLLRFVVDPAGRLLEDLAGRLPGRAVYVTPAWPQVENMLRRAGGLRKLAAGKPLLCPAAGELQQRLVTGLHQRWREGLGLARRAGGLRKGLLELEEILDRGQRPLVLLAADTAGHTRQKLAGLVHRYTLEQPLELMNREEFGLVCGLDSVAVLSVVVHGLALRVKADTLRWMAFVNSIH